MRYKDFSQVYTDKKCFERDKLQFFFDKYFREKNENALRNQYRALRSMEFSGSLDYHPQEVDISALTSQLTGAWDVLIGSSGCSFIYCGNDTSPIMGNCRLLSKAILSLLSNAYLYGKERLVTVKTLEDADFVKIEVQNGGCFSQMANEGEGLSFVRRVCERMDGRFFIETTISHSKAVMLLKKSYSRENSVSNNIPDPISLIYDRLSPVYVELYGMEYH